MKDEKQILTFEEATHTYKLNGVILPSVTQILKTAGLVDLSFVNKEVLEYKSDLGKKVHTTTELYDKGNLDIESLHPILKGYLDGWIKFRKDFNFSPILIEWMSYHPRYRYTGTVDRIGNAGDTLMQLDIKSGSPFDAYALQSAAYTELYNFDKTKREQIKKRLAVYLKENGTYKVQEYKNQNDIRVFYAALTITNYLKGTMK